LLVASRACRNGLSFIIAHRAALTQWMGGRQSMILDPFPRFYFKKDSHFDASTDSLYINTREKDMERLIN
jgi:hypothetical protein